MSLFIIIVGSIVAGAVSIVVAIKLTSTKDDADVNEGKITAVPKTGNPTGMYLVCGSTGAEEVELGERTLAQLDTSAPVVDVLAYLRWAGLKEGKDYAFVPYHVHMLARSPMGKIPYVICPDGKVLYDSLFIIEELEKKRPEKERLDGWLGEKEKAYAAGLRSMLHNDVYWPVIRYRFAGRRSASITPAWVLGGSGMPPPVAYVVFKLLIQRPTREAMRHVIGGLGRGGEEQVDSWCIRNLTTISGAVSSSPFLMGERICSTDLAAYSLLSNILRDTKLYPFEPIVQFVYDSRELKDYALRVQAALGIQAGPEGRK